MNVLQIGVERSGNSWLYRLIEAILERVGIGPRRFIVDQPMYEEAQDWTLSFEGQDRIDTIRIRSGGCSYGIAGIRWEPIEDMRAYASACSHVWTHSRWCSRTPKVLSLFDRAVYIVRDPRDIALSKAQFAFSEYSLSHLDRSPAESPEAYLENRFYGNLLRWVKHVGDYLLAKERHDLHFVTYEGLLHDFQREVRGLIDYLSLDLESRQLESLEQELSFSWLKRKGPEHLQKGRSYRWMEELSDGQKAAARRIAGPMLELLGYPLAEGQDRLPNVPDAPEPSRVRAAIEARRGGWRDKVRFAWTLLTSSRGWWEKVRKGIGFLNGRL